VPSITGVKKVGLDGWVASMMGTCISCGKRGHDEVQLVSQDGSVWYRCPVNKTLCYIREAKDGKQEAVRERGQ